VIDAQLEPVPILRQQLQESHAVVVGVKDGLAGVAAIDDVVARGFGPLPTASTTGHDQSPPQHGRTRPFIESRQDTDAAIKCNTARPAVRFILQSHIPVTLQ
jgi:hypothetical protein